MIISPKSVRLGLGLIMRSRRLLRGTAAAAGRGSFLDRGKISCCVVLVDALEMQCFLVLSGSHHFVCTNVTIISAQ